MGRNQILQHHLLAAAALLPNGRNRAAIEGTRLGGFREHNMLSFNEPGLIAQRQGIANAEQAVSKMAAALSAISEKQRGTQDNLSTSKEGAIITS